MRKKPGATGRDGSAAFDWHSGNITRSTPITPTYRSTQKVRRFFIAECGPTFRFDVPFMAWIREGTGKTMGDAADEWLRTRGPRR